MDVAGPRRRIEDEIVQLAPVGIGDELFQGRASHAAPPQGCGVGIHEETDAQQFHTVFLHRFYQVASVLLHGIGAHILHAKHLGHGRAEDVGIEQSHLIAQLCQGDGKIGRDGTLAHATLAGTYGNNVLNLGQHLAHLRAGSRLELGGYLHLHFLRHMIMDGCLGGLHRTLQERVGITGEEEYHLHLHAIDAGGVSQHPTLYQILLGARINDRSQGIGNQLGI